MSIKYFKDLEQGTDEWHAARLGIVTASEINNLVTPKGKQAAGAKVRSYACDIASQRANMEIEDTFQGFDMMRGHFQEDLARKLYDENYASVDQCGFVVRQFDGFKIGCSPDGLVGEDGGIEIKSRLAKFQVETIVSNAVPDEYANQCQAFLLVTGRKWVDFVQYSNGMPMFVKRVLEDGERQGLILKAVADLEKLVGEMGEIYKGASKKMVRAERIEFVVDDVIVESDGGE